MPDERYEELMVKAVDGTADPAEREELMSWLVAHPELRSELEAQRALKALTDGWVARLEHDLAQDAHHASRGYRLERALGWMLLLAATGVVGVGTLWEIWADPEAPRWLQIGLSLGAGGTFVLLASAIRWRWNTVRDDPYTEVTR